MEILRALIADDHPLFRHGVVALLGDVADMEVLARRPPARRQSR